MDPRLIGCLNCFSPKFSYLFHINLGRTDMRTDSLAQIDTAWMFTTYPWEHEAGGPLVSLIFPADPMS